VDKAGTGTVPAFETDSAYRCGMVLHQYFGAKENVSYTRMDNPLKGQNLDGATVSLWVKRLDSNVWDALWSFFSGTSSTDVGERLFLTGNSYLGYNNNAGAWFDINHPNDVTSENIPEGEWTLVTYTFDETGVKLYINGEFKEHEAFNSNSGTAAEAFDYSKVLDWLSSANYFYLGMGSFWGSAPAEFDDILIYNRALTQEDITGLNTMENRDYNFASGHYTPTGIFSLEEEEPAVKKPVDGRIYDLNGRILNATPRKGIYIQDGKKKIAL
jgi:arabinan endo-1,5-alpha-L-arabinosidase